MINLPRTEDYNASKLADDSACIATKIRFNNAKRRVKKSHSAPLEFTIHSVEQGMEAQLPQDQDETPGDISSPISFKPV